ncbi:MAG: C1 family peptidase [Bdellovibrionia bacterium]
MDVQSLQKELDDTHSGWVARRNHLTQMSHQEVKRFLGLAELPQGHLEFEGDIHVRSDLPKSIDWRNHMGYNWLGEVMNQGNCGSCVAFATVATLEAQVSITSGIPWLKPSFSPQELFSCGGGSCNHGWMPGSAASYLVKHGVADEACMPYTSGSTAQDRSCQERCQDADQRATKITRFSMPSRFGGSIEQVKKALKNGPLETALTVHEDFISYSGGVYRHVKGESVGGHAVSLVGYSDEKRAWLIRNSWGPDWGEGGFAWVSWEDRSGVGANTWAFEVAPAGSLAVTQPLDRSLVSGTYELVAQVKAFGVDEFQFRILDSAGGSLQTLPCVSAQVESDSFFCKAQLDSMSLKEGLYQVFLEHKDQPALHSQHREFYVINHEPQLALSFQPVSESILKKPITERVEFWVQAESSPIPMEFVEFRVFDRSGKLVSAKRNQYVLEKMKLGWRPNGLPPGKFEIQFHGEIHYQGKTYEVDSNRFSVELGTLI